MITVPSLRPALSEGSFETAIHNILSAFLFSEFTRRTLGRGLILC
jgi:hypothetical protein